MAFMLYEHQNGHLKNLDETYSLAGHNLIFRAWQQNGSPTNQGWHVSANDLIQLHTSQTESYATRRLLIDFHPNAAHRIGIIELLDVYIYTWGGNAAHVADWNPMMLRMRDVFYQKYDQAITADFRNQVLQKLPFPRGDADFVEFLYLNGTDPGWGWGRNGMTNAAFLQGAARDYFRQFF